MLQRLLAEKREGILRRWLDLILETYPVDTRSFLRSQKNQFTNPVGHAIIEGIGALYNQLLEGDTFQEASEAMDKLIRIRAVQDLPPSVALGFIPALKEILREEIGRAPADDDPEGLRELEARLDRMVLLAFDLYSRCREQLYQIRVNEVRVRTERLLKMANLVYELPEEAKAGLGQGPPGS